MVDLLELYTLNYGLFNKGQSWSEPDSLHLRGNVQPLVPASLCKVVAAALKVMPLEVSRENIVKLDKNRNVVSNAK